MLPHCGEDDDDDDDDASGAVGCEVKRESSHGLQNVVSMTHPQTRMCFH